jgi:hypothetical protein
MGGVKYGEDDTDWLAPMSPPATPPEDLAAANAAYEARQRTKWDEAYAEAPSPEFLAELAERARRFGWSGDYVEVERFVRHLFAEAEIEPPDLEPYSGD